VKHSSRAQGVILLASLLSPLGLPSGAAAQEGQGQYLKEASGRLARLIGAANKQGYILKDKTLSLGGGWLTRSNDWLPLYKVKLEEGKKYRFLAAGDADAEEVDLKVVNADGKVVAQNVNTDPEAVVDFTPGATGQYAVRIRLYASMRNVPCVCVAIVMTKKN
jgi:hypothetical protein